MNKKTYKILAIILLSILVIILFIFYISVLTNKNFKFGHFNFINHKVSNELVVDKQYEKIFENIKIITKSSNIEIKQNDTDNVKVKIYGDKKETSVDVNNNTLNIKSSEKKCIGFCFNITIAKIEIYLPSNYSGSIDITNNYGDIILEKFNNLTLNAKLDAGDIIADSLYYGKINNSYGNIKINGNSKKLDIKQNCGDIEVNVVDNIKVKNSYGDIEIKEINEYLDAKADCGDIEINSLNLKENSNIYNDYGDIEIGKTNEIYINAKTNLGDTKVRNNYQKSDITLDITNSCGDIEVNN